MASRTPPTIRYRRVSVESDSHHHSGRKHCARGAGLYYPHLTILFGNRHEPRPLTLGRTKAIPALSVTPTSEVSSRRCPYPAHLRPVSSRRSKSESPVTTAGAYGFSSCPSPDPSQAPATVKTTPCGIWPADCGADSGWQDSPYAGTHSSGYSRIPEYAALSDAIYAICPSETHRFDRGDWG